MIVVSFCSVYMTAHVQPVEAVVFMNCNISCIGLHYPVCMLRRKSATSTGLIVEQRRMVKYK